MSLETVQAAIRMAVRERFPMGDGSYSCAWVQDTLEDAVVVCSGEKLYRFGWAIGEQGAVTLTPTGEEVVEKTTYESVQASVTVQRALGGKKFLTRVVAMGETKNSDKNGPVYFNDTPDELARMKRLVAGMKIYGFKFSAGTFDHLPDAAVDRKWLQQRSEYGYFSDPVIVGTEVHATANLHDDVPDEILAAIEASADPAKDADEKPVGLSIDAACTQSKAVRAGKVVSLYSNFRNPSTHPASTDIVTSPAAKGEWLARVAASIRARKERTPMILAAALAILATETSTPAEIEEAKRCVASARIGSTPVTPPVEPAAIVNLEQRTKDLEQRATAAAKVIEDAAKAGAIATAKASVETLVRASKLPQKSQDSIIAVCGRDIDRDETIRAKASEHAQKLIDERRAELAEVDSRVRGGRVLVEGMTDSKDKAVLILDRMLLGNQFDAHTERVDRFLASEHGGKTLAEREKAAGIPVAPFMGPRRALALITGIDPADWRTGGYLGDPERVRASVGATAMADLWADRMHKVALAYGETSDYRTNIRKMAKVISVSDFRNVDFVALGAYGNLPAVAKSAPYVPLSTPNSQGHEFAISKYGGTEGVAWEDIVNDDQQVVSMTPRRLQDAYWRTLFEAVADKYLIANLTTDTTDYDSTAWCTTARTPDNFATTAFAAAELAVVVKLMFQATDFFNGKRLGLRPKFLLHPIDLELTVRDVLIATPAERPGITTDYSYAQSLGIEPILVPHWTNAKDHVYIVNPTGPVPPQVLAFLNGQEAPTIDTQDMRNIGAWFERDSMLMKISGVWGNDLVRHEGIFAEDVA